MLSKILSKKHNKVLIDAKRECSQCGIQKPLDKEYFQVVKSFRKGFSYYCNECNKPKPRDN